MVINVGLVGVVFGVAKVLKINNTLIIFLKGWKTEQRNMFLNNYIIGKQRLHLVLLIEAIAQK